MVVSGWSTVEVCDYPINIRGVHILSNVSDVISSLGKLETPYETLKTVNLEICQATLTARLQEVLSREELGDEHLPNLISCMKKQLEEIHTSFDQQLFKQLFYIFLPHYVQRGLITVKDKLEREELSKLADELLITNSKTAPNTVYALSATPKKYSKPLDTFEILSRVTTSLLTRERRSVSYELVVPIVLNNQNRTFLQQRAPGFLFMIKLLSNKPGLETKIRVGFQYRCSELANHKSGFLIPQSALTQLKQIVSHQIDCRRHTHAKARRLAPERYCIVREEFNSQLQQAIMRPSFNSWSSAQHVVTKKNGGICPNDLLVTSPNESTHETHLCLLFKQLKDYGIQMNIEKSAFEASSDCFLEHTVTGSGITLLKNKCQAICLQLSVNKHTVSPQQAFQPTSARFRLIHINLDGLLPCSDEQPNLISTCDFARTLQENMSKLRPVLLQLQNNSRPLSVKIFHNTLTSLYESIPYKSPYKHYTKVPFQFGVGLEKTVTIDRQDKQNTVSINWGKAAYILKTLTETPCPAPFTKKSVERKICSSL
ncbi:unnamed protein product [Lepeophtheirus salmonis]|uniref:(salmon louse) hypothetical protein n=1 Tax=Lepeophtheirus salmonis TaxID=72036 RepID=A0A7R8H533_LEPSM|nr:unnamed protein product [Lepeophtheirus salmonis]CAF2855301.1 unnamed protein product [Lepeophtheirus salmonis]